jgi:hypothetical protein
MNRRIRSSSGCSRRAAPRGALLCLAIGLGLLAAACSSDLFHDTKWQSRCDAEPDAAICPQGTGGAGGMSGATTTTGASSATTTAASSSDSSASSTAGAGGGTSTSTGGTMAASSSSSG